MSTFSGLQLQCLWAGQCRHCSLAANEDHRLALCKFVTNIFKFVLELLTTCFMAIQNWFFLFRDNISILPYTSIFETVFLHLRSATILHII